MSQPTPLLIRGASQIVAVAAHNERSKSGSAMSDAVVHTDAALLLQDGNIAWLGPEKSLPKLPPRLQVLDARGGVVLPGFVDSHTHLIFAGTRTDEFDERLRGSTYQAIAARGGGINASVRAVRGT